MNTIANIVYCLHGLCGHVEHKINSLWWIIPVLVLSYIFIKKYDKA